MPHRKALGHLGACTLLALTLHACTGSPDGANPTFASDVAAPPQPARTVAQDVALQGPTVLASGQGGAVGLVVDRDNVYWVDIGEDSTTNTKQPTYWTGGRLLKCGRSGCDDTPTVLASARVNSPETSYPFPVAIEAGTLYWADSTGGAPSLFSCSVDGCEGAPTRIGTGGGRELAVHDGHVYWTQFEALVSSCSVSGCGDTPRAIWSAGFSPLATGIAVDASGIYWATLAPVQIMKCAIGGCDNAPTVLMPSNAELARIEQIAVDTDNVYFADRRPLGMGMILKCPKAGCEAGPTVLASGLDSPIAIATDGLSVYWVEAGNTIEPGRDGRARTPVRGAGSVRKCAVAGCDGAPVTVVSGIDGPADIVVDATRVYWTSDASVWMADK